jgi:hypothetical protein|nr:GNAT family N-acetyltransferase [Kofleriaceae bacterium]
MLALPDEPRWIEAHGIDAAGDGWRESLGARAFAIGHDATRLVVIADATDADPDAIVALVRRRASHGLLFAPELAPVIARAGRVPQRAVLHALSDPTALPDLDGATPLAPDAPLDHLPAPLAAELAAARARDQAIWAVYLDDQPVSFAYAPWRSPRWFDVSIDTLQSARQLGLGTIAAAALVRAERAHGREPVWGTDEHNAASRALARRLGFLEIDELGVAAPAP